MTKNENAIRSYENSVRVAFLFAVIKKRRRRPNGFVGTLCESKDAFEETLYYFL